MRKFGLFSLWVTVARGWTKRFCNAGLDENFLMKENAAEALLSGHPNANGNMKIQSLYGSWNGVLWRRRKYRANEVSLTESVCPESSHCLFSVSQSKQDTCDRKINRQVVFSFAWLLFVETKGIINKLWELYFNVLKNFWNNINEAKNRGNE